LGDHPPVRTTHIPVSNEGTNIISFLRLENPANGRLLWSNGRRYARLKKTSGETYD
jgi:hypothetical protein